MSEQAVPPGKSDALGAKARAKAFVDTHLQALASEVLDWDRTGIIHGDKLPELAEMCKAFTVGDDEMQVADGLVRKAALLRAAGRLR